MTDLTQISNMLAAIQKTQSEQNEKLDDLVIMKKDYFGDNDLGRIGVAKMAREAYSFRERFMTILKWVVSVGTITGGATAATHIDKVVN